MTPQNIDFSMIPMGTKQKTTRWYLGTAIIIFLGIWVILGIGGLIGGLLHHAGVGAQIAASVMGVTFFLVVAGCGVIMVRRLGRQKRVMQEFARVNGWQYEGRKIGNLDPTIIPPGSLKLGMVWQRFKVSGQLSDIKFDLFQIMANEYASGTWKISGPGLGMGRAPVYATVLRLTGRPSINKTDTELSYEYAGEYTYVTLFGNAISRQDVERLFNAIT